MPNSLKIQKVQELSNKVKKSQGLAFFEYTSLTSNALNDLRRKIEEVEAEIVVTKNTLAKLALGGKKPGEDNLQGQTALIFAYKDNLAPIKILYDATKKFGGLKIKGAFLENTYYTPQKVLELGQLPSRLDLIARMLAGFKSPISNFVYGLHAIADKKGVQG